MPCWRCWGCSARAACCRPIRCPAGSRSSWSLGMVTVGLVSSTLHLGHPERAWRAFSQWRSSWLSREGVLAVFTFLPAGIYAIGWLFLGELWALGGAAAQRQRVRDGVRDGDDLCQPEADPRLAQPVDPAGLSRHGPRERRALVHLVGGADAGGRRSRPTISPPSASRAAIALKLTYWHFLDSGAARRDRRKRHRPRRIRQGAHADRAAHRGELSPEGDGLPHRAQACAEAAPHRAHRRLRAAARRRARPRLR